LIIVIGLLIGVILGLSVGFHVPVEYSEYMAVAILASLDSVFGGIAARLQHEFRVNIFLSGFFGNTLLAVGLTYIGKLLDLDIYLVALLVFGARLFQNFAIIRRVLLNKLTKRIK
jgi:small basic protein